MLWLGAVLIVVSVASFLIGFVLFANAVGVAPQRRAHGDPTGLRRAADRVEWSDVFRRIPSSFGVMLDDGANRSERLAAAGSLFVFIAILAAVIAVLAFLAALI